MSSFAGVVDAVIGLTLPKRSNFTIDYQSHTLTSGWAEVLENTAKFDDEHYLVTPLCIAGHQVNLAIDTGSMGLILSQKQLTNLASVRKTGKRDSIVYMGAEDQVRGVELQDVRIGDAQWPVLDGWVISELLEVDGLLGFASLNISRLSFDFQQNRPSWN